MKAAIYARISKDRVGAGLGVERQLRDCRDLADQLGLDVVREYTDNDLSAYSGKPRPGYAALLAAIEAGRAYQHTARPPAIPILTRMLALTVTHSPECYRMVRHRY